LSHVARLAAHPKFVLVFNANCEYCDGTIIHNDPELRQTGKKLLRKGKEIHLCFIDLKKAFDRMRTKKKRYLKVHETKRSRNKYDSNYNQESAEFESNIGLKQRCVLSALLFSIVIDDIIKNAKKNVKT
jgi:hypothetical protein